MKWDERWRSRTEEYSSSSPSHTLCYFICSHHSVVLWDFWLAFWWTSVVSSNHLDCLLFLASYSLDSVIFIITIYSKMEEIGSVFSLPLWFLWNLHLMRMCIISFWLWWCTKSVWSISLFYITSRSHRRNIGDNNDDEDEEEDNNFPSRMNTWWWWWWSDLIWFDSNICWLALLQFLFLSIKFDCHHFKHWFISLSSQSGNWVISFVHR